MAVSAATFLLVGTGFLRRISEVHDIVALGAYSAVGAVFIWRSFILIQAQRGQRRAHTDQEVI